MVFKTIERLLSSVSSGIIAISDIQKQELCDVHKVCSHEKTYVVPLGFDLNRFHNTDPKIRTDFRTRFQIPDESIAIGIIGRLVPIKNHTFFIEAFQKVKNDCSLDIKAVIIGDGEDRQLLEELCQSKGLRVSTVEHPNPDYDVVFTSWIYEVETALAGCDIIALTSLNEGTPVSLIEAQAAGKPIVSTNVGGIANVVHENHTALLSSSLDVEAFAENLKVLVQSESLRKEFSENGWPFVKQKFHYERLVNDIKLVYRDLLKKLN
jgi:glycosyltransferase involved in cell wall biosynthesis